MNTQNGRVKLKLLPGLIAISLFGLAPIVSVAQDSNSEAQKSSAELLMEEVIVTSRKKEENLQTVPVAVTALSGVQVEATFANTLEEISYHAPNAIAQTSGTFTNYVNFFIRGMGAAGTVLSDDPAVGIFVDGVYAGLSAGVLVDVFDLESVEILRGPQGTLFGRNVTGGAALIRTRKPTEEFSARARLIAGSDGRAEIAASISGPMGESVLGKLVFFYKHRDDWMDNPDGNAVGADDLGEKDQKVVRGALTWLISDSTTADFRFEHGQDESDNLPIWAEKNDALLGAQPIPGISVSAPRSSDDPISNGATMGPVDSDWTNFSLELNFDVGRGNLQSITAFREIEQDNLTQDFDGSVVALFDINNGFIEQDQFSQEFVYNMTLDNGTQLTAGAYYFDQTYDYGEHRFGALFAGFGGGLSSRSSTDHEVLGVFVQADIELNERWILTLGGRYSSEEKNTEIGQFGGGLLDGSFNCTDIVSTDPLDCPPNFFGKEDWSNFTPKVSVQYAASDATMLYLSWSQGFRSGGFNIRQNVGALPGPYNEEQVDAYEFGFKSTLADGSFRINGAFFYNDYSDLQRTVITAEGFQSVANAAAAKIQGAEFEASWLVTESFILQASIGFMDTEINDFVNPGTGVLIDGTKLPFTPDYQYTFSGTYDVAMNSGTLSLHAMYHKEGDANSTDDNLGFKGPSWDTIDASISYSPRDGNWRVTLFGKNLSDNIRTHQISNAIYSGPDNAGWVLGTGRMKQELGVEFTYDWN